MFLYPSVVLFATTTKRLKLMQIFQQANDIELSPEEGTGRLFQSSFLSLSNLAS